MAFVATTATKKIAAMRKRIRAIPGGTSAGKTIGVLQVLIDLAQTDKTPTLTSVVAESIPHLKAAAIRDFKSILQSHNYWRDSRWNATDRIYTFETGSLIEFFSSDNGEKCRGPRRDRLFYNEANRNSFQAFEQLEVRTKEFVFLDWNPSEEFWYYTELKGKRDDIEEITLTFLDNEGIPPEILDSINRRRNRPGWWKVYGEGQLGEVEGKIYSGWQIIDELPFEARLERRGLDFGYSNDPTAVIDIYRYNDGYILDEVLFQKGISNKQIADTLNALPKTLTVADSAEPKSIDELRLYGLNIVGAEKGAGSVLQGIQFIQDQRISVTKRSVNLIKAYRNYLWMTDKNGKILNVPDHQWSDCLDAARYGFSTIMPKKERVLEDLQRLRRKPKVYYGRNFQ